MKKISLLLLVVIGLSSCEPNIRQMNSQAELDRKSLDAEFNLKMSKIQLEQAKR